MRIDEVDIQLGTGVSEAEERQMQKCFHAGVSLRALIGGGTLGAMFAFVVIGLAVAHSLGGARPEDATVLVLVPGGSFGERP